MSIYTVGMFIYLGRLMVQFENEPDTFRTALKILVCAVLWPILVGIEIEKRIEQFHDEEVE